MIQFLVLIRRLIRSVGFATLIGLASCATSGQQSGLPISVADLPQAAALRTAPRIALVIGNDAYTSSWNPLKLAANDARLMARTLKSRGFTLIGDDKLNGGVQTNVSATRFRELLSETEAAVRSQPGAIVTVFFSGHGFTKEGHNYLVATDAPEQGRDGPAFISVGDVAHLINNAGAGLTMMFLDACRDFMPGQIGLVDEKAPDNTFIGFSAQFGTMSQETLGGTLSTYTKALLEAFERSFDRLDDMHIWIARRVIADTRFGQAPAYRQGDRMPPTPIRFGPDDAQTAFALVRRGQNSNGALLASQCAAMSDFRLMLGNENSSDTRHLAIGPKLEPADVSAAAKVCEAAYASGHREVEVIRGLALTTAALVVQDKATAGHANAGFILPLLTEAAERGDGLSTFTLAVLARQALQGKENGLGLDRFTARDRLIRAANTGQAPLTALVGLILWSPDAAYQQIRERTGLREDRETGLKLIRQAVMSGDPLLQPISFGPGSNLYPIVSDLPLRQALLRSLESKSAFGFHFEGMSVHQTLYIFAINDALYGKLGPRDEKLLISLVLAAEDFIEPLYRAYNRMTGQGGLGSAAFHNAGCILGTGRSVINDAPIPGLTPNPQVAARLLYKAARLGSPTALADVGRIQIGQTCL